MDFPLVKLSHFPLPQKITDLSSDTLLYDLFAKTSNKTGRIMIETTTTTSIM